MKKHLLFFLLVFFISLILNYTLIINYDIHNIDIYSKISFFNLFFDEFAIVFLLLYLLPSKRIIFYLLGLLIFISYVFINILQIISVEISGEFFSKMALANINFIGLMINSTNITIILIALLSLIVIPTIIVYYSLKKYPKIEDNITSIYFTVGIIIIGVIIYFDDKYMPESTIKNRDKIYQKNNMQHSSPIQEFFKIIKKNNPETGHFKAFTPSEINTINSLGIHFNPLHKFPFKKNTIYSKHLFQQKIKPNIIIIFTEGYSARTNNAYTDKFHNLTPNLLDFSTNKNTMIVDNFFNHTAATYRGLHGQLCSLYPTFGGGTGWHDIHQNLPTVTYKCLPHILQKNGYKTIWLNAHYKNASKNDEMVSHFGFDQILSAEDLLTNYRNNQPGLRKDFLTDQESYSVLINYLKNTDTKNKPFMIGIYTVETHAWIDTKKDGIKYKSGKYNGLNTIHNMDNAFGKFWKYFKKSKYFDNTIIVFTSDHAHYYEKSYLNIMKEYGEKDYQKIFVDKVPLLIYDPVHKLSNTFAANNATSIDLAPTLAQLLNLKNETNAFNGTSIFEEAEDHVGFSTHGNFISLVKNGTVYTYDTIKKSDRPTLELMHRFVAYAQKLEMSNRLIEDFSEQNSSKSIQNFDSSIHP